MRLSQAKRRYRGQWLAFVIERVRNGDPEGTVVAHARSRRALHTKLKKQHPPDVYLTFAGPPMKPGYIFFPEGPSWFRRFDSPAQRLLVG